MEILSKKTPAANNKESPGKKKPIARRRRDRPWSRGTCRHDAERGTHRRLQRTDRRGVDGLPPRLPAAVPLLDGCRGCARRAGGRPRRARSPAGVPLLARPQDRRARAEAAAAGPLRRPLGAAGGLGHAATRPGGTRLRLGADRARDPGAARPFRGRRRDDASFLASSRQVAEALERENVRGRYAPITAITKAPPRAAVIAELAATPGAAAVLPARQVAAGLWRLDILPRDEGLADSSQQLVHTVRAKLPDARVTGQTAAFVDQQASLAATCRGHSRSLR